VDAQLRALAAGLQRVGVQQAGVGAVGWGVWAAQAQELAWGTGAGLGEHRRQAMAVGSKQWASAGKAWGE